MKDLFKEETDSRDRTNIYVHSGHLMGF